MPLPPPPEWCPPPPPLACASGAQVVAAATTAEAMIIMLLFIFCSIGPTGGLFLDRQWMRGAAGAVPRETKRENPGPPGERLDLSPPIVRRLPISARRVL